MQHSNTTSAVSHAMWRVACAFIVALLATLMLTPDKAEADGIRVSCRVYATNQFDPIGGASHMHRQVGNLSLTDASTGDSLYANESTSCQEGGKWWTNAGWAPVEGTNNGEYQEPVSAFAVYYRAPEADDSEVMDIQRGMELIARVTPGNSFAEVQYDCNAGPGNTTPKTATPQYGCADNFATHITFPRCWDGIGIEHTDFAYGPNRVSCPATHPYMIPEITYTIVHPNTDGRYPNPLQVSGDDGMWHPYTSMHADYFFAAQDEFTKAVDLNGDGVIQDNAGTPAYRGGYSESSLLDLCLRKAPESLEFPAARCRVGGLLPWHQRAINNYYN
jgi:hypothetical protein